MTQGMEWLLIAWGVVTGILLILLFYRSTLTRQELDQLFIERVFRIKGNGRKPTDRQGEQDKSALETGRHNFGPDDLGNRKLALATWD